MDKIQFDEKDLKVTQRFIGKINAYEVTVSHLPTGVCSCVGDQDTTAKNTIKAIENVKSRLKFRDLI